MLPPDLWCEIFSFLSTRDHLLRVSITCKLFRALCEEEAAWPLTLEVDFYDDVPARFWTRIAQLGKRFTALKNCPALTVAVMSALLPALPNLRHLSLWECSEHFRGEETLSQLRSCGQQLVKLNLNWCNLQDADLSLVGTLCPNLEHLYLGESPRLSEHAFSTLRRSCPGLTDLNLAGASMDARVLASLDGLPLRHLNLNRCGGTTDHCVRLAVKQFPDLQSLSLSGCGELTEQSVLALNKLESLMQLDLMDTNLSQAALSSFRNGHVRALSLGYTGQRLDRHALVALGHGLASLESLFLQDCPDIQDAALTEFVRLRTTLRALHVYSCQGLTRGCLLQLAKHGLVVEHDCPVENSGEQQQHVVGPADACSSSSSSSNSSSSSSSGGGGGGVHHDTEVESDGTRQEGAAAFIRTDETRDSAAAAAVIAPFQPATSGGDGARHTTETVESRE